MSIGRDEVIHVARLAEIAVADNELPTLVEQLSRIVDYVAQLDRLAPDGDAPPFVSGPDRVRLREDVVDPIPLAQGPAALAPEFEDGFFLVPRRGAGNEA